jgi:arylsulfatase A-like enzyme
MTDQQRYDTIAAWGYEHMVTPHMDRLAREGVSFIQTFCPGVTCISSRAAMFTGMYPHNTGVYTFDRWAEHRNWVQDLADHGYWCVNIGKMHFSPRDVPGGFHERTIVENPTSMTHARGGSDDDWGRYLSFHGQERPLDRNLTDPEWMDKRQGVPWHLEERYHSDVFIGQSAVSWIRDHQGERPLFLQVGFTGPHEPWDPMPRHLALYGGRETPRARWREGELETKPPQQARIRQHHATTQHESYIDLDGASEADIARMRRHYYAKITTVDEQIGRVLEALEERGWLEDSLLVFCSDHGEMLGDHAMAYKWLMYEPIVHVPLVVRAGSRLRPGFTRQPGEVSDLVSLMDVGPTVLEAAGIPIPTYFEGRSLIPYLRGGEVSPREYVFSEDNYQVMMRGQRFKLVYYIGQEQGELYDLERDPHELWNLWDDPAHREVKQGLLLRLLDWLAGSTYWNAGYKRTRERETLMRWPTAEDVNLHGRPSIENAFRSRW